MYLIIASSERSLRFLCSRADWSCCRLGTTMAHRYQPESASKAAAPHSNKISYRERFWYQKQAQKTDSSQDETPRPRYMRSVTVGSRASTVEIRSTAVPSHSSFHRTVRVCDHELVRRAVSSDVTQCFQQALDRPLAAWRSMHEDHGFTTLTTSVRSSDQILVVGEITCTHQELAILLCANEEAQLNASMRALYGNHFIYSSVVHRVNSEEHPTFTNKFDHLIVKTSSFSRSRMLAKNEEWCYLEYSHRLHPSTDDFEVVQLSMHETELAVGKAKPNRRLKQLGGVSVVYRIEAARSSDRAQKGGKKVTRVTFLAKYQDPCASVTDKSHHTNYVDKKTANLRLEAFAASVRGLPAAIRKRRLGRQVFADTTDMSEASNSRCISCTRTLHRFLGVRRCQLCSYNICEGCCSSETVETYNGHSTTMLICRRCLECVDRCDYTRIQTTYSECEDILDDYEESPKELDAFDGVRGKRANEPRSTGVSIVEGLVNELRSGVRKDAAMTIIHHLLSSEDEVSRLDRVDATERGRETSEGSSEVPNGTCISETQTRRRGDTINSSTAAKAHQHIRNSRRERLPDDVSVAAVQEHFRRRAYNRHSPERYRLANARRRSYPIELDPNGLKTVSPVPSNETDRMDAIEKLRLMDLRGPIPELDIICDFLNKEMDTSMTEISVIGAADQLLLACSTKSMVMTKLPREHTICQHLLMDDKPFMINHPEADVRFYNIDVVAQMSVRFYCGIPIKSTEGLVIGSLCCIDTKPRRVTRSQLDTLTTFGRIASRVIMNEAASRVR